MSDWPSFSREGSNLIFRLPSDPYSGNGWRRAVWEPGLLVDRHGDALPVPLDVETGPRLPTSEVRLARPVIAALTPELADGDLRAFIRDQHAVFHIAHFACGFKLAPGERIDEATLTVHLRDRPDFDGPYDGPGYPIAWSMQPLLRSGGAGDRTTTVRVGANLKFVNVGIDHSRSSQDEICIQARGELTSNPWWDINHTRAYTLDRDERFVLIVRRDPRAGLYMRLVLTMEGSRREGFHRRLFSGGATRESEDSLALLAVDRECPSIIAASRPCVAHAPVHVWSTQIRASQSSDDRLGSDRGQSQEAVRF